MRAVSMLFLTCFMLLPGTALSAHASGKIWPLRQVSMVLPSAAGNEDGSFYAAFAGYFSAHAKVDMTLRAIPGRSGADAWSIMDGAENDDGHTITAVSFPNLTLLGRKMDSGVNRNSMQVCAVSSYIPAALWAPRNSPFTGLEDFIALARKAPGKLLVAGNGSCTAGHIAWAAFDRQAGIRTIYLPHMGSLEAGNAVNRNLAAAFWADAAALPALKEHFRPLAVASEKRSPAFPDVPTFAELGYAVTAGTFRGIALPKTSDSGARETITGIFAATQNTPSFREEATALGFTLTDIRDAALDAFLGELETRCIVEAEDYGL